MLTKNDLSQIEKVMRKVAREEIENEAQATRDELGGDIVSLKVSLFSELREIKDRIKNLEIRVTKVHADLKKEIRKFFDFHDEDLKHVKKRLDVVENKIEQQVLN